MLNVLGIGNADDPQSIPTPPSNLVEVVDIASEHTSNSAIRSDGTVWRWGSIARLSGVSGVSVGSIVPTATGVTSATAVTTHCARQTTGEILCWGSYPGDGTSASRPDAVLVSGLPGPPERVIQMDSDQSNGSCVVMDSGTLYCWGHNENGTLGFGDRRPHVSPSRTASVLQSIVEVAMGRTQTCVRLRDGRVYCWGLAFNQFSPGTAIDIPSAVGLDAGGRHACAILSDRSVRCWGENAAGQLGDDTFISSTRPVAVVGLIGVTHLAGGDAHTCARRSDGTVWCWGSDTSGQLGSRRCLTRCSPGAVVAPR